MLALREPDACPVEAEEAVDVRPLLEPRRSETLIRTRSAERERLGT
jgi:hypothetical protein